jgi:oligopeptide transport system ATP-binding protein
MSTNNVILEVKNLKQFFRVDRKTTTRAVDDVSFKIFEGETFSVVGESGSGKSTLGRTLIRIYDGVAGEVEFMGKKISGKLDKETKHFITTNMQMIFQDPMASLNPRKKVLDTVAFGLDVNKLVIDPVERKNKVIEVLKSVGLSEDHINRFPHQFSGGQRQRIGVARALVLKPKFIIADEIISALDVSIQAQVINLMKKLQRELGLTYLFIAHDLSMVRYISDRVAVMHLGHIVEMGTVDDVYNHPMHPYTKSLLSAIPHPDPDSEKKRKRFVYDMSTIIYNDSHMVQLSDTHSILTTDKDFELWSKGDYSLSLK